MGSPSRPPVAIQRHTPYVSPSRPPVAFQRHTPYVSPSRPPVAFPAAHTVRVSITSSKWHSSGTHRTCLHHVLQWHSSGTHRTCLHHVLQVAFQRHTPYVSPSRPPSGIPAAHTVRVSITFQVAFQRHT